MKISTLGFIVSTLVSLALITASYLLNLHPGSVFIATGIGLFILYRFYRYERSTINPSQGEHIPTEAPNGYYSGQLTLDGGVVINYEHAWQKPIVGTINSDNFNPPLPNNAKFVWIKVEFGNGRVVIEPKSRKVTIPPTKDDLKVSVKISDKIKASIGY